ncbi:MAG: hypothetical protein LAT83_12255 [Kiritimatiellae bacterium]|nr:hypothetical protein [Kiritimatiellia bacterium]
MKRIYSHRLVLSGLLFLLWLPVSWLQLYAVRRTLSYYQIEPLLSSGESGVSLVLRFMLPWSLAYFLIGFVAARFKNLKGFMVFTFGQMAYYALFLIIFYLNVFYLTEIDVINGNKYIFWRSVPVNLPSYILVALSLWVIWKDWKKKEEGVGL